MVLVVVWTVIFTMQSAFCRSRARGQGRPLLQAYVWHCSQSVSVQHMIVYHTGWCQKMGHC